MCMWQWCATELSLVDLGCGFACFVLALYFLYLM